VPDTFTAVPDNFCPTWTNVHQCPAKMANCLTMYLAYCIWVLVMFTKFTNVHQNVHQNVHKRSPVSGTQKLWRVLYSWIY